MATITTFRSLANMDSKSIATLGDTVTQSASAGLLVQSYCTQVAQQPMIVIPDSVAAKLPPIGKQLETAQANASAYLKTVQPQIIGVVTDVGGYAQQFTVFNTLINGKIEAWKGGSSNAKAEALVLLQQLQRDLDGKVIKVAGVRTSLEDFRGKLNTDISNFNTAAQQAALVIEGSTGAIAELSNQIDDMNKRIAGAAAGVAISGLVMIGGGLMIALGAIGTVFTGGASTPLIIAGVAVTVLGAAGLTASSVVLAKLIEAKSGLLTQQAQLKGTVTFLTDFKGTMGTLGSSAATAAQQLTNMKNAWDILGGNLGNVVASVQSAQTYSDLPVVVQAYLNTAASQWTTVLGNVTTIQNQMSGVKSVKVPGGQAGMGALTVAALQNLRAA
ncbi:HBL/NHE enterotoxin family protein [Methylobacterium aquaticum]|uniref:HBL/NHE enterotoxin family protein n=1 Tax=Methylobacterium aquaticum TaxID=270351 RepID=UPI003D16C415